MKKRKKKKKCVPDMTMFVGPEGHIELEKICRNFIFASKDNKSLFRFELVAFVERVLGEHEKAGLCSIEWCEDGGHWGDCRDLFTRSEKGASH